MAQRVTQVDAFTDRPFAGNPATVCILAGPADERWMQQVANDQSERSRWVSAAVRFRGRGDVPLEAVE